MITHTDNFMKQTAAGRVVPRGEEAEGQFAHLWQSDGVDQMSSTEPP